MLPNAILRNFGIINTLSTVSSVASDLFLLCIAVQAANPLPSTSHPDDAKFPSRLLGYNEHRTDLPGGRQANVRIDRPTRRLCRNAYVLATVMHQYNLDHPTRDSRCP